MRTAGRGSRAGQERRVAGRSGLESGGALDGVEHVGIGAAAAEIPGKRLADLRARRLRVPVEKDLAGKHHPGGAESALQRVGGDERLLQGSQAAVRGQALDRRDRPSGNLVRERQARADGQAVDEDRAGPAGPAPADDLRPRQADAVPQGVDQRDAGLDGQAVHGAVDLQLERGRAGTHGPVLGRGQLRWRAGGDRSNQGAADEVSTREAGLRLVAHGSSLALAIIRPGRRSSRLLR